MLDPTALLWTEIIAAVCLLLFAGSIYNVLRLRAQIAASKAWRKTEGEIITSQVKVPATHRSDDEDDVDAVIRYRYRVDGRDYENDCIKLGGQAATTRVLAEAAAAKYPAGARVDVFYDPRDAKTAALDPRRQDNVVALLAFTLVFGAVGGVLAAHAIAGKVLYANNGVPMFAFLLPVATFLVALLFFVGFVLQRRTAKASASWPTVAGTVTTCAIVEDQIEDKDDKENNRLNPRYITRYRVDLRFGYRVGSRDFVGTTRTWGWTPIYGRRDMAEKAIGSYATGQSVTVHYDPAQPDSAVLEPGNRTGSLAPLVAGCVFAAGGALMLAFFVNVGFGS